MKRDLICILCPRGCQLTAEVSCDTVKITGNGCPRGARYGESECLHPVRTVTATVRVSNRPDTMASVKTETPVPKQNMLQVMEVLRRLQIQAPANVGDVIAEDVFGSKIVVTKNIV